MAGAIADARIAAVAVGDSENGRVIAQGDAAGADADPAAENYKLTSVKFTIVRYDLPSEFYMSQAAKLGSGGTYKLWFPNYSVQSCASVAAGNKTGVNRTSISCRSLDWVMGTFRLPGYTTVSSPLNVFTKPPYKPALLIVILRGVSLTPITTSPEVTSKDIPPTIISLSKDTLALLLIVIG